MSAAREGVHCTSTLKFVSRKPSAARASILGVAAPRGRAYALAIIEEAAFLPTDYAANPDIELLRAVRPALARIDRSLLCVVSSPYARRGVLWTAWKRYHDRPEDGDVG